MLAEYWNAIKRRHLLLPTAGVVAFTALTHFFPRRALYFYLVFYLAVILYFHRKIRLRRLIRTITRPKRYLLPILLTGAGVVAAHLINYRVLPLIPVLAASSEQIEIMFGGVFETILYAVTMILLMPVAEALFFRKALIVFRSGFDTFLTASASIVLAALLHANGWLGVIQTFFLTIPLTISYVRTKNYYISLIIHFLYQLITLIPVLLYDFAPVYMDM